MNRKPQRPERLLADATSNTKLRKSQTEDKKLMERDCRHLIPEMLF